MFCEMRCKVSTKVSNLANFLTLFCKNRAFFCQKSAKKNTLVVLGEDIDADELDAGCGLALDGEAVGRQVKDLAHIGDGLVLVEQVAGQRLVVIALGDVEVESLVDFLDFHASREFVACIAQLTGNEVVAVVLVLDFAEDFLDQVLEGHHAAGAAELSPRAAKPRSLTDISRSLE